MNEPLKFIDMFAGIGGFRSGMVANGMKPVGWIEWNKWARQCYEAMYDVTNEFTASDIQEVKGVDLPDADIWTFGSPCFTEDALVQTDKDLKKISDIKIGDKVLSIDGKYHKVINTMVHPTTELYDFKVDECETLHVTGNHPIWVRYSYKQDGKLLFTNPKWERVENIKDDAYVLSAKSIDKTINKFVEERGWLIASKDKYYRQERWKPVKKIEKKIITKPVMVYNLGVEGTHTYNVNGIIVHNCQDISVAGRQEGLTKGKQSSMFFEVIRLAEERIKAKKSLPRYLWLENVKNLLSSNSGRDFARVILEMDKIGYDVEWSVIDSAELVPQHRERVYVIGHLRKSKGCTRQVFPITRQSGHSAQTGKIKVIGNASKTGYRSHDVVNETGISKTIDATAYKHKPLVGIHQIGNYRKTDSFGGNPQTGRVYGVDGVSPTLNTMQGGDRQPKVLVRATITPDRINKRQNGRRFKEDGEPSFTLTAEDRHGVMLENDNVKPPEYKIRKLTPLECWRLQGFTDEQFKKAKDSGVSDSQLYARAGNAVSVPVIQAIAEKIVQNESENKLGKNDD